MTEQRSASVEPQDAGVSQALHVLERRPPVPPFTRETATLKVRLAEDGWNSRKPEQVVLASTPDARWRDGADFANGRREIIAFLTRRWAKRARLSADQGLVGLRR